MNKIILTSYNPLATIEDIEVFESAYGYILTENLKKILLKVNGGLMGNHEDAKRLLSITNGIATIDGYLDTHQKLEENIQPGFLPFAADYSDNPFMLNLLDGEDFGKVFFAYFDCGEIEPFKYANSLEEFFGVKDVDEIEVEGDSAAV